MSASYKKELSKQAEARIAAAGGSIRKLAESHRREAGAAMRGAAQNIAPRAPKIAAPIDPRRRYLPSDRPDSFIGVSGGAGYETAIGESEKQDSATNYAEPAFPSFGGNIHALAQYFGDNIQPEVPQRHEPVEVSPDTEQLERKPDFFKAGIKAMDDKFGNKRFYPTMQDYIHSQPPEMRNAMWKLYNSPGGKTLLNFAHEYNIRIEEGISKNGMKITEENEPEMKNHLPFFQIKVVYDKNVLLGDKLNVAMDNTDKLAFILGHELAHAAYGYDASDGRRIFTSELWNENVFQPEFGKGFPDEVNDFAGEKLKNKVYVDEEGLTTEEILQARFAEGYAHLADFMTKPRGKFQIGD